MPHDESRFLARIVDAVATVPGITAIVLGDSRASGTHSLCALNEQWVMNEKGIIALAAHLPLTIDEFAPRVAAIYATLHQGTDGPSAALTILSDLIAQGQSLLTSLRALV